MTARYIIGDVFDVLATLKADSVDLIFSSPPFLALRSYLPADHPDKTKELGSEETPADFLDAIGIDLDDRNADLALDRVGPMFLTVEHLSDEGAA